MEVLIRGDFEIALPMRQRPRKISLLWSGVVTLAAALIIGVVVALAISYVSIWILRFFLDIGDRGEVVVVFCFVTLGSITGIRIGVSDLSLFRKAVRRIPCGDGERDKGARDDRGKG